MNLQKSLMIPLFFIFFSALQSQSLFDIALSQSDSTQGELLKLNGFVRSLTYVGTSDANKVQMQSLYSQLGLTADVSTGSNGSAHAEFRFRSGNEFNKRLAEWELREAYINLYLGPVEIVAGKQILTWGASSFINPSDQFSPQNPTYRSPQHDDMRLGTWALKTKLSINSASTFQFLWMPSYTPSVLLTEPFTFPAYVEFGQEITPSSELKESNFGFSYDLRTRPLDLQLSFYHGYRNNPAFTLDTAIIDFSTLRPESIRILKTPYRINSAGLNLTIPIASYLFRTEIGWMDPVNTEEMEKTFSELSYSAEIEQSGNNITLIGGYYGKYILDYKEQPVETIGIADEFPDLTTIFPPGTPMDLSMIESYTESQIEGFNRLYNYQNAEFYHAAYASITISLFYDFVDLELPCMYNFTSEELTLMPSLKFNITDGLSVQFGAYYLYGKENSIYDLVGPVLNAGYGQILYKF